jgi:hypothetical protein
MHGQLSRNLDEKLVDNEQPYRWLKSDDIKGETGSTGLSEMIVGVLTTCHTQYT